MLLAFVVFSSVLALTACTKPVVPPALAAELVLDPQIVKSFEVDYWVASGAPNLAISPDDKYMLMVQAGANERIVAAVLLAAGDQTDISLYTVSNSHVSNSSLDLITAGWLSETKCVYVAVGDQPDGANAGKYGAAVFVGDISTGKAEEVSFIELEKGGNVTDARLFPDKGSLYLVLGQTMLPGEVWTVDLVAKNQKLVREGLPTYDNMFIGRMSPDGSAYAYQLHEVDGRHGIFLMDAVTGKDSLLAPSGETMGMSPEWSPDGRYLAFYTVPKREGSGDGTWFDYEVYRGDDSPLSIAPVITVVDRSGNVVGRASVEGKVLTNICWSPDSKSLAFVAGPKPKTDDESGYSWTVPEFTWDSVWTLAVESGAGATPEKLWDIDPGSVNQYTWITPVTFDPEGQGVLVQVSGENSGIWYVGSGNAPIQEEEGKAVKILSGHWMRESGVPAFGDSVTVIGAGEPGDPSSLWLVSAKEAKKVGEWKASYTSVVAYNDSILVTCEIELGQPKIITVRSMFSDKSGG